MCVDNNRISNNLCTKFLGLIVDSTLSWKPHIDHLINKLSTTCYVIRSVKPYVSINVIMIYMPFPLPCCNDLGPGWRLVACRQFCLKSKGYGVKQ
jgi:hypothetical protein